MTGLLDVGALRARLDESVAADLPRAAVVPRHGGGRPGRHRRARPRGRRPRRRRRRPVDPRGAGAAGDLRRRHRLRRHPAARHPPAVRRRPRRLHRLGRRPADRHGVPVAPLRDRPDHRRRGVRLRRRRLRAHLVRGPRGGQGVGRDGRGPVGHHGRRLPRPHGTPRDGRAGRGDDGPDPLRDRAAGRRSRASGCRSRRVTT